MSARLGHVGLLLKKASAELPEVGAFRAFRVRATRWVAGNSVPGDGLVRLSEFRILSSAGTHPAVNMTGPSTPTPLVATASSFRSEDPPWKAFDGFMDNGTRWVSAEVDPTPQWLEIDLGAGNAIVPIGFTLAADENVNTPSSNFIIDMTIEGTNTPGLYDSNSRILARHVGLSSSTWLPAASSRYFEINANDPGGV